MPLSVTDRPATTRAPPAGAPMKERTVMRMIGTVLFGAVPGSTLPHGVSGIRYAGFIQNFSKTWSITEISERFFTQYVAYHPGTTRRAGKPLSMGKSRPFIPRGVEDPDGIVAYQMNGRGLPMINGFPARLVVPGWYATYWVKNLSEISVIDHVFEKFWMKPAYRIPDTPCGCVEPGTAPKSTVPITRMTVRSFIGAPAGGARVVAGRSVTLKGIAFDGGYGVREVQVSDDEGVTWRRAQLGPDLGRYSFREWSAVWTPSRAGEHTLMVRALNAIDGVHTAL